MPFFAELTSRLFGAFVSSSKTPAPPPSPTDRPKNKNKNTNLQNKNTILQSQLKRTRSMSPQTRIAAWKLEPPSPVLHKIASTPGNRSAKKRASLPTPSSSGFAQKKRRLTSGADQNDRHIVDVEAAESNGSGSAPASPTHLAHPAADANDETIVDEQQGDTPDNSSKHAQAVEAERHRRHAQSSELASRGWPPADVALFTRLSLRGFEPLLPSHWEMDFRALPAALFTGGPNTAYVRALGRDPQARKTGTAEFRATRALEALLAVGPRVRDRVRMRRAPERVLRAAVDEYLLWGVRDAGLAGRPGGWLPGVVVVSGGREVSARVLQARVLRRLTVLHARWEGVLGRRHGLSDEDDAADDDDDDDEAVQPPQLYGVVLSHVVMAFVSLEARGDGDSDGALRTIAMFDFSRPAYDVWNAFAVAILACHVREVMARAMDGAREFVVGGGGLAEEDNADPDA